MIQSILTMKKIITGLFLFLITNCSIGQDVLYKKDVLPPSPETAAFIKNVNIPVSYSSGTPQISIPFGSVRSGGIEVPVSISYNASGIRVEEVPSWVGLGWSLSAGGQITRTVRDKADEAGTYGYMVTPANRKVKYIDTAHCRCVQMTGQTWGIDQEIQQGFLDLEPDQYTFSILGYSGDFYYSQDSSKFVMVPYQNIKIDGSPLSGSFTLTLPDGVKCYFGSSDSSREVLISGTTTSYIDGVSNASESISGTPQVTSWYLSSIISPNGDIIDFVYNTETVVSFGRGGERFGSSIADPDPLNATMRRQSFYNQYIRKPVLSSIMGESGDIRFKRSSAYRIDIPVGAYGGSRSLDTILIYNNGEVSSYYFYYEYFTSASIPMTGILGITQFAEEARRRLCLKSITQKKGMDSLPPYLFTYNEIELPSRLSTSQDYWGYFNGKSNGLYLMPRLPSTAGYGQYLNYGGADRRIDTNYSQARMLKRIKYPTGGSTEYFFEPNRVAVQYNLNSDGGMEPPDMVDKSFSFNLTSNPFPSEPPYPLYYAGVFNINIPVTKIKITPQLQTCTTYNDAACKLTVKIRKLPDSTLISTLTTTNTVNLPLTKGQYLVEVLVNGSPSDMPPIFQIDMQWGERTDSLNFIAGGVRVKRIVSSDSLVGRIVRSYSYLYDSTQLSSGDLAGIPTYKVVELNQQGLPFRTYYASNSAVPLTDAGKTVRYRYVSEYYDTSKSSFKISYSFTEGLSDPQFLFAGAQTGAPILSWPWQNDLLKKKELFEKTSNGTYRIVQKEENYYQFYNPITDLYGLYGPQIVAYDIATEWYLPDSTHTTQYSYPGGVQKKLESGTKTLYNSRFLPSISKSYNSTGEAILTKTWYPGDFNNVSGFNISTLLGKYIINIPIKAEVSVNGKIRAGNVIKYNANGQAIEGYNYEGTLLADTSTHNPATILPSGYKLLTTLSYDGNGNLKQQNNYKSGPVAYIWDYQVNGINGQLMNNFPVAVVQNADSTSIAYCSFEAMGTGNWSYTGTVTNDGTSPMGKKCLAISGAAISKSGLSSGTTYIVSYWSKNGSYALTGNPTARQGRSVNGWTYYEHDVTGTTSLTISGTGSIDELRLYPKGSLMTTQNYLFGVGVLSQSDPNNRITYYDYDGQNRLTLIRDQDWRILKKICYSYTGQAVNCGYDTSAAWTAINSVCEQTNGINTGNLIVTEKNMNPSSATYNQTRTSSIVSAGGCPVCNVQNCTGADKKCINNLCETGQKIYTGSQKLGGGYWKCFFHYKWSDNTTSPTYDETSYGPCPAF